MILGSLSLALLLALLSQPALAETLAVEGIDRSGCFLTRFPGQFVFATAFTRGGIHFVKGEEGGRCTCGGD